MSGKAIAARLAATQLLHAVLFDGRRLSGVLASPDNPLERLVPQDRARAQALSTGVLRHLGRIDAILERYLEKPPAPRALQALRVAAFEMLAENIPSHAAVNAAVEIVRGSHKAARQAGLVNAVARKLAREGGEIWQQQEPQSLPSWLATPIRKNFGAPALGAIEAAHEAGGTLDITLRDETLLGHYRDALSAIPVPTGSLRLTRKTQISALPGFAQGAWWVQDAAAALAVRLLGDIRDQRILDICAAPGGKTMQLAAAGAEVSALDVSASRAERLRENLARTGLRADVIVADARDWSGDTPFDAVLLDAPCSATGTI
ncbi:MAG: transcription antitermination factor NusB, partial [Paracoccaceae bacterium]